MPPCNCAECGLNPTFVCGVVSGCPPSVCCPIGLVFPIGSKDGLVPSCYELEPEKARLTFCGPSGLFAFQFHLNGRLIEFPVVGLGL